MSPGSEKYVPSLGIRLEMRRSPSAPMMVTVPSDAVIPFVCHVDQP